MAYAADEWSRRSEIEGSARDGYLNDINHYIKAILGE
jgi:hypothetical protein